MKKAKIDKLGRIVIPVSYRKVLHIDQESELILDLRGNEIVITPSTSVCKICSRALEGENALSICDSCIAKIKSISN